MVIPGKMYNEPIFTSAVVYPPVFTNHIPYYTEPLKVVVIEVEPKMIVTDGNHVMPLQFDWNAIQEEMIKKYVKLINSNIWF